MWKSVAFRPATTTGETPNVGRNGFCGMNPPYHGTSETCLYDLYDFGHLVHFVLFVRFEEPCTFCTISVEWVPVQWV